MHLGSKDNLAADILVYEKDRLKASDIKNRYTNVPANVPANVVVEVVVEVDTKADLKKEGFENT